MFDTDMKFWAGSEESFAAYLLTLRQLYLSGDMAKTAGIGTPSEMERDPPRLFSKHGDVGIIRIAGSLVNNDNWYNRYYSMTGYPEIREALIYAVTEGDVKALILDVASGGGAVAGVFDTATLIARIDKDVMPVHTFSDANICSAAYLLGSAARSLNIGPMTEAGSIGVLMVHQEVSKMMSEIGVKPTVLRAGKYKALGNPYEPLSELAKSEFQSQLDFMYDAFIAHVAEHRDTTVAVADEKMGQGRVLIGDQAVKAGLADEVIGFDALVTRVQAKVDKASQKQGITTGIATGNKLPKYAAEIGTQGTSMPKALTEQDVAALAEGATSAEAPATPAVAAETPAQPEQTPAAPVQPAAPAAAAPATSTAASGTSDLVTYLQTQLTAAQAQVASLTLEAKANKDAAEKANQMVASLRPIVEGSVNRMRVALGQSGTVDASMSNEALLAEQEVLRKQFEAKFKAGGVAAVSATDTADKSSAPINDAFKQARLAATRAQ